MRHTTFLLSLALLAAPLALVAQSHESSSNLIAEPASSEGAGGQTAPATRGSLGSGGAFSRLALGGGISTLGINLQAATNLNRYLNLRASGNVFQYTANNISSNGFSIDAKASLASAGASVDIYPFPKYGFRLSPGVLFYNQNGASGTFLAKGGTSFTLNGTTYYASSSNPIMGVGNLGLHTTNPAFTVSTGWGSMIPRKGGHWSFPLELGVAVIGAPTLSIVLSSGQVCDASGLNCVNVASDASVQSNLAAQVAKYTKDLEPLKTYPIFSAGVAYSFKIR